MAGAQVTEIHCKTLLNKLDIPSFPFRWTLNPYRGCRHACSYCYARPTHEFWGMDAGRDFEQRVFAKVNAAQVLRQELKRPGWRGESIAIGTASDPYEPAEAEYELTRKILQVLVDFSNPASITTKGVLARRDVDLLSQLSEVAEVSVNFSIGTVDDEVWKLTEPGAPRPPGASRGNAVPGGKWRQCRGDGGPSAAGHQRRRGEHRRSGGCRP